MAQCIYCRRSAGLFRTMHEQCRERHDRAVSLVPGFFAKFMDSNLSVVRFHQLLQSAAEASFIPRNEMKTLSIAGISQLINAILKERLPDKSEAMRISDLAEALQTYLAGDPDTMAILAKIDVLRELGERRIPDFVTVAGPMPIELRQGETVIWIFNHVTAYRREKEINTNDPGLELAIEDADFCTFGAFGDVRILRDDLQEELSGDIVVTNRNIYAIDRKTHFTRLPIARITGLKGYTDGIHVTCQPTPERTITFVLDDSWFAANLVLRLVQLVRREGRAPLPTA